MFKKNVRLVFLLVFASLRLGQVSIEYALNTNFTPFCSQAIASSQKTKERPLDTSTKTARPLFPPNHIELRKLGWQYDNLSGVGVWVAKNDLPKDGLHRREIFLLVKTRDLAPEIMKKIFSWYSMQYPDPVFLEMVACDEPRMLRRKIYDSSAKTTVDYAEGEGEKRARPTIGNMTRFFRSDDQKFFEYYGSKYLNLGRQEIK